MADLPRRAPRPARGTINRVVTFHDDSEDGDDGALPHAARGSGGRGSRATPLLGGSSGGGYPKSSATPSSSSRLPRRQRDTRVVAPSIGDDEGPAHPSSAAGGSASLPGEPPPPPPRSTKGPIGPPPPLPPSRSLSSSVRGGPPSLRGPPRPPPRARSAFEDEPPPALAPAKSAGSQQAGTSASGRPPPPPALVAGGAAEPEEVSKASALTPPPPPPPPSRSAPEAATAASAFSISAFSSAGNDEEDGFWARLAKNARGALGLVSDIVSSINYETDSEQEDDSKENKSGTPSDSSAARRREGKSSNSLAAPAASSDAAAPAGHSGSLAPPPLPEVAPARSGQPEADDTLETIELSSGQAGLDDSDDQFVEYVTAFCVYLGVDVAAEPHLIQEVAAYLKQPLPDGWRAVLTDNSCEFGAGFTYYMHPPTAHTQWTRPDEEDFLRVLAEKMKRRPLAGSRLFFSTLREHTRKARAAALEAQVGHLPDVRPLLRAMPEGGTIDDTLQQAPGPGGVVHVALHNQFPILHAAAVEAFSAYFGLGSLIRFGAAELRQLWIMKVAALCPVPEGWEFRFDEVTMAAVFVDSVAGTASRHHPLDAFFAGLLERTMSRHRGWEAVEAQRTGKHLSVGDQIAFFVDAAQGDPYWLRFDKGGPLKGYVSSGVPRQAPPTMGLPRLATPATPVGPMPATPPAQPAAPAVQVPAWQSKAPPPAAPQRGPPPPPPPLPPKPGLASGAPSGQAGMPRLPEQSRLAPGPGLRLAARAGEPPRGATEADDDDEDEDEEGDEEDGEDETNSNEDNESLVSFSTLTTDTVTTLTVTTGRTELSARRHGAAETAAAEAAAAAQASAPTAPPPPAQAWGVVADGASPPPAREPSPARQPSAEVQASTATDSEVQGSSTLPASSPDETAATAPVAAAVLEQTATPAAPAAVAVAAKPTAALSPLAPPPAATVALAAPAASAAVAAPPLDAAVHDELSAAAPTSDTPAAIAEVETKPSAGPSRAMGSRGSSPAPRGSSPAPPPPTGLPAALPVLPSGHPVSNPSAASGLQWEVQNGKWQLQGTAARKDDDEGSGPGERAVPSRAPPLLGKRAASPAGRLSRDSPTGASAPTSMLAEDDQQTAMLNALADRLRDTPQEDVGAIVAVLEALEAVPVTVHQLRTTQLGVLTQAFKDHSDKRLRTVARRLRRSWKDVVQAASAADEADGGAEAADAEMAPAAAASIETDAGHGMAPPPPPDLQSGLGAAGLVLRGTPPRSLGKPSSPAGKRQRAELTANLQWLCRLFLETREQLFALHEGQATDAVVCTGLREEFDVVHFKRLLEEALMCSPGRPPPRALRRMLRALARRALHGRRLQESGRRLHERFVAACAGHSDSRGFVTSAVPRVLQLITRIVEEDRRGAEDSVVHEPADASVQEAEDVWADSDTEEEDQASWRPESASRGQDEAEELFAGSSGPGPLRLPSGEQLEDGTSEEHGNTAPRGAKSSSQAASAAATSALPQPPLAQPLPRAALREDSHTPTRMAMATEPSTSEPLAPEAPRRVPARPPFVSGELAVLTKVSKAPLSNLDGLIDCLVPGADLTTEGLLLQLADDELMAMAYMLEQITEAASKRLVRELEVRDELRSTCLHRREYLQLLDTLRG